MRLRPLLLALLAILPSMSAQTTDPWKKLDFLLGDWVGVAGEKDTPLGAGQGAFSFKPELQQKIIVRRNNATYNSGTSHDDLLVIYLDTDTPRAIYFDSEGHVIRYNVAFPEANHVVFESEAGPGPKYRLSYWMDAGSLNGRFEVAPPGGAYQPYLNWKSKRSLP